MVESMVENRDMEFVSSSLWELATLVCATRRSATRGMSAHRYTRKSMRTPQQTIGWQRFQPPQHPISIQTPHIQMKSYSCQKKKPVRGRDGEQEQKGPPRRRSPANTITPQAMNKDRFPAVGAIGGAGRGAR
ncbi:expressed protein [Echinococcus multilocularis]|uniref:Expressed protein n=1 Tax=Echinococcus multilocularis TaxID=6211 RepID=A0A068Y8G3_ECHMU|nr:expressed protein [Echinococcus multilocularis]